MLKKLRKILLSWPLLVAAGLFASYLLAGFLALPPLLKWQAEKFVREKLEHGLSLGAVRFHPLRLELEINALALADAQGRPMLGLRRLLVEFELRRSIVDRAWSFAAVEVDAPALRFELDAMGRHNFAGLLERLAGPPDAAPPEKSSMPRVAVRRIALGEGRIEITDLALTPPLIASIAPLTLEVDALSTWAAAPARYRVDLQTAAAERFESRGELALNPVAAKGQLALGGLQVATVVRALSRQLAVGAPAGRIDAAARFDLGQDAQAQPAGTVHDIEFAATALSLSAAGGAAPLLELAQAALTQGRLDLGGRALSFASMRLADGRIRAATDASGRLDWATLAHTPAASSAPAAPALQGESPRAAPSGAPAPAAAPWKVSIENVDVKGLALGYADAGLGLDARVDALSLAVSPTAQFGPAGVSLQLAQPTLAMAGVRLSQRGDDVVAPELRVSAGQAKLSTGGAALELGIDAARLQAAQGLSVTQQGLGASLGKVAVDGARLLLRSTPDKNHVELKEWRSTIDAVQAQRGQESLAMGTAAIGIETLRVEQAETGLRVEAGVPTLSAGKASWARGAERGMLDALSLSGASVSLTRAGDGALALAAQALRAAAEGAALNQGADGAELRRASLGAESVSAALRPSPAGIDFRAAGRAATASISALAARRGPQRLALAEGSFQARTVSAGSGDTATGPGVSASADTGPGTGGTGAGAGARAGTGTGTGAGIGTGAAGARAAQPRTAAADAWRAEIEDGTLRLQSLAVQAPGLSAGSSASPAAGSNAELARLERLEVLAKSLRLGQPDAGRPGAPMKLGADGVGVELADAVLRNPADNTEVMRLGRAAVGGAALRLHERQFSADSVALAQGELRTWLDAGGRLNLLALLDAAGAAAAAPPSSASSASSAASPASPSGTASATAAAAAARATTPPSPPAAPWRVAVKEGRLDALSVGFEDRRESPPLALRLDPIQARIAALDTASAAPMKVELQARLASGGEIRAEGDVRADNGAADLALTLSDVSLAPVQGMLSKFAHLRLASASASARGRLRSGPGGGQGTGENAAGFSYQGMAAIDGLLLQESASGRDFLAWESVATDDLSLTLQPGRADIGELRVGGLKGRLVIAADQSVNLSDVLRKREGAQPSPAATAAPAASASAPAAPAAPAADADAEPFPVRIARLRLADSVLEFSDLSLRPQFAARLHELKGVISGLGTDPNGSARIALDARVDEFGSAAIGGRVSVFKPEQLTEIDMEFRNLELSPLSPYVVKFAGYRIASGRLALDLQYKVANGKMLGQNKIVLNQMVLGEKVESPGALDLPLELAVAILKDSKGVIDIGLPVSGNLDDPQFDYGAVIGKAIGNLLGGIVTAPFRALGALFGGGNEALDTIDFEAGSDQVAPPQREKLVAIARALKERPTLGLVVPPTYSVAQDRAALKSLAVRRQIVGAMGIPLAAGEDPGPIDPVNPRARAAIESVFSTRYAPAVLAVLKERAIADAAAPASAAAPAVAPAPAPARARPAEPPPAFHQGLLERLISEQEVDEAALQQLALRRGEAVVSRLVTTLGVPAARSTLGPPNRAPDAQGTTVTMQLELKAAP